MVTWTPPTSVLTVDTSPTDFGPGAALRAIEKMNRGTSGLRVSLTLSMRTALFRSLMISSKSPEYASVPYWSAPTTSIFIGIPHRNPELSSAPPTAPMYWESWGTMGFSPRTSPTCVTRPEIRDVPPTWMIGRLTSISWSCCS